MIAAALLFVFLVRLPVSRVRQTALIQLPPDAEVHVFAPVPGREGVILDKLHVRDGQRAQVVEADGAVQPHLPPQLEVFVGAADLPDRQDLAQRLLAPGVRQQLRGGADLMETIERGMGACPGAAYVLLVTADIPALTAAGIDAFVRAGIATGADFVYPIIPRAANEARFPGVKRFTRTP